MKPKIPTFDDVRPYLKSLDESRWYSNYGPLHEEAITRFSLLLNVDPSRVCLLSNATLALVSCMSLSPEKNWLVPEYTFSATGLAPKIAGKNLYSADVDDQVWTLRVPEFSSLELGITPVMPFGKSIYASLFKFPCSVIVDAAASIGGLENDFSSMKNCDAVIYSLHATKILGCGEGALVVCGSQEFATALRQYANFGFVNQRVSETQGINAKLSEIHASYILAGLDSYDKTYLEWRDRLDLVDEISNKLGIRNITNEYKGIRPYWIATFENSSTRAVVEEKLRDKGIQTRQWWPQLMSEAPGISSTNVGEKVQARRLLDVSLGLPMWQDLPLSAIYEIGEILETVI